MAKKDKKDSEVLKTPEQPVSNVRAFFTKEITDQIGTMGVKEMESIMKGMVNTREFIAILKYTNMRTPLLDMTLRGTDPTKDAHKISWAQGALAGLCDVENYIIDLNAPKQSTSEEPQEDQPAGGSPEGVIMG